LRVGYSSLIRVEARIWYDSQPVNSYINDYNISLSLQDFPQTRCKLIPLTTKASSRHSPFSPRNIGNFTTS
jgi:hypothetical protein